MAAVQGAKDTLQRHIDMDARSDHEESTVTGQEQAPFETPCNCGEGKDVPWNDHDWNCPWFVTEGTTPRGPGAHINRGGTVNERDCKAVLAITGEWFPCQEGRHLHPIHGNSDAEVIWVGHDEAVALPSPDARDEYQQAKAAADGFAVGPTDHLVLVSKGNVKPEDLREMVKQVPEALRARVLVVDGTMLDAKVVRDDI